MKINKITSKNFDITSVFLKKNDPNSFVPHCGIEIGFAKLIEAVFKNPILDISLKFSKALIF